MGLDGQQDIHGRDRLGAGDTGANRNNINLCRLSALRIARCTRCNPGDIHTFFADGRGPDPRIGQTESVSLFRRRYKGNTRLIRRASVLRESEVRT